jgi:hypothetical protein
MLLDELLQTLSPAEALPVLGAAFVATAQKAGMVPADLLAAMQNQHVRQVVNVATEVAGMARGVSRIVRAIRG